MEVSLKVFKEVRTSVFCLSANSYHAPIAIQNHMFRDDIWSIGMLEVWQAKKASADISQELEDERVNIARTNLSGSVQ